MNKLIFLLAIAISIFAGCSEDDDDNNNNNNNTSCIGATMSLNFAGSNSTQTAFNNTLLKQPSNGQDARRLDLRTNVGNGTLVLSVSNWDFQNPPENGVLVKSYTTLDFGGPGMSCTNISGTDFCDGGLVSYVELGTGTSYFSVGEGSGGFVDVDVCDAANKIVSGTFSDILVDFINEDTIEVSGSFSNLCYSVL